MSLSLLRYASDITCHCTSISRTCSTSLIHREVIQANGQSGSNQKSAVAIPFPSLCGRGVFRGRCQDAPMPGTNLTRDEAATRASLLDVTSYTVDLDLMSATQPDQGTFGSVTTLEFTCREPGSSTFADLVAPSVREITLNGRSLDPATAYADHRITLDDLEATNTLVVTADCAYSNTGEGLHRFVDPADDRVYLYSPFEVPDARRVFTTFEQPD